MSKIEYKSTITTGSLLVRESRIIARMLIDNVDSKTWYKAITIDNVLQKRSPESARRQACFVKERLALMQPELWKLIDKGSSEVVIQAALAASIKHSRLLGDFMNKIVKSHWQVYKKRISAGTGRTIWKCAPRSISKFKTGQKQPVPSSNRSFSGFLQRQSTLMVPDHSSCCLYL
jgi:hypothetical protein